MKWGGAGAFLIDWAQTEIDDVDMPLREQLVVGASWSWRGSYVQISDQTAQMIQTGCSVAIEAALGSANTAHHLAPLALTDSRPTQFVLTDGAQRYTATVIETARAPVVLFEGKLPPRNAELLIVENRPVDLTPKRPLVEEGGVICFTPGTLLRTGNGQVRVEDLRVGDLVQTKDNGLQPIQWIGSRRMTGARMFALPELCPVRVSGGAFGINSPDQPLIVSPHHRMLVSGAVARDFFGVSEVLVVARDLISRPQIAQAIRPSEVTYVHVLLPSHNILWANGVETESFHPANAAPSALAEVDWQGLLQILPFLQEDRTLYGGYARKQLASGETRQLMQAA
ncbi:MAG: Hint domain-containing protein [Roseobacter sp.]